MIITAGTLCTRLHFNLNYLNPAIFFFFFFLAVCLWMSSTKLFSHIPFADLDLKSRHRSWQFTVGCLSPLSLFFLSLPHASVLCVDSSLNYRVSYLLAIQASRKSDVDWLHTEQQKMYCKLTRVFQSPSLTCFSVLVYWCGHFEPCRVYTSHMNEHVIHMKYTFSYVNCMCFKRDWHFITCGFKFVRMGKHFRFKFQTKGVMLIFTSCVWTSPTMYLCTHDNTCQNSHNTSLVLSETKYTTVYSYRRHLLLRLNESHLWYQYFLPVVSIYICFLLMLYKSTRE